MKRLFAAVVLVAVAATGCGGDSKPKLGSSTPPTSLPSLPTSFPSSLVSGLASGECQEVAQKFSQASSAFSTTAAANTPLSDRFAAVSAALDSAKDKVDKADVKAAFATLSKTYADLAKALKGVSYTPGSGGAPPPAYTAALQSLGDPKFAAAANVLSTYFASGCK